MNKINIKTKHVAVVLIVIFTFTILPILFLGIYDYPCADDYSYASATRQVWLQSRSVWQVLKEAVSISASRYQTWQGTFTSIFFMALQPAIWTEKAYCITPFIMTGILSVSVFYLLHVILVQYLEGTRQEWIILSLIVLIAVIQCMVDKTDAFFWYNGSVHYIVPFSFLLLMQASLISALTASAKEKRRRIFLSSLYAVFVGGGNYISGLTACVCSISLLLLLLFMKKLKEHKTACIPVFILVLSFLINMAAPGNSVRGESVQGMPPLKSIMVSFRYTLAFAVDEWTDWTIWALVLFSLPFIWKVVKNTRFRFPCPFLAAAYSYCLVSSAFTPALYATGNIDAGRIRNIIFILYVLLLFLNAGYAMGWACHYFQLHSGENEARENLTVNQRWYVILTSLALFFGLGITIKPNPDYYTTSAAVMELVTGEARAYGQEMEARIELLQLPDENIVLPCIQTQPALLYHSDITFYDKDWSNIAMSRYYGKQSIILSDAEDTD